MSLRHAALLLQAGRLAMAENLVRKHMKRTGEDAEAFNLLGVAMGLLGRTEEAREAFSLAVALDPASEVFRANLEREVLKLGGTETRNPERP